MTPLYLIKPYKTSGSGKRGTSIMGKKCLVKGVKGGVKKTRLETRRGGVQKKKRRRTPSSEVCRLARSNLQSKSWMFLIKKMKEKERRRDIYRGRKRWAGGTEKTSQESSKGELLQKTRREEIFDREGKEGGEWGVDLNHTQNPQSSQLQIN